jgi:hypothetical protein
MQKTKICTKCKKEKSADFFRSRKVTLKSGKVSFYLEPSCKVCESEYFKTTTSSRDSHRRLRIETIMAYSGRCSCCGEDKIEVLDLDHVNGDGGEARRTGETTNTLYGRLRRNGFPKGEFQVLCRNCNWQKWFFGECSHTKDLYSRFETSKIFNVLELEGTNVG